MKPSLRLCALLFLWCAANAHAQLYKWVGPDGKVSYTDTPPPPSAKHVETKSLSVNDVNTAGFPYELSEAVKGNPVTLYTTANCAPCDEGRKLLNARGIPFSEKTVGSNEDIAQLKKIEIGGDEQLPLLVVGRSKERGFAGPTWNAALTSAGYPETSRLPKNYRNPQAEAAAPAPKTAAAAPAGPNRNSPGATSSATDLPPAAGNAPPGFRF